MDQLSTEAPVAFLGRNYRDHAEHNPCDGCSAPCCKVVILPQPVPETFRALDRLRFLVAHRGTELLLDRKGDWQVCTPSPCRLLTDDDRCSVHGTPDKPKICVSYSPYNCWYKRNFHEVEEPPDFIRMDLDGYERILAAVTFDDDGNITEVPPYDDLRRLAAPPGGGRTLSA